MDSINTKPARSPITTTCRCCGGAMAADWQPPLMKHLKGCYLITCWNKNCEMFEYTLNDEDYTEKDLSAYLCKK